MANMAKLGIGVAAGALLAVGAFVGGRARSGAFASAACPAGWRQADRSTATGARALLVCTSDAEGMDGARIELLWTHDGALDAALLTAAARRAGHTSEQELRVQTDSQNGTESAAVTRERPGANIKSDVYFLSAGPRYGLLSIVYGPAASFVREDTVAAWMDTVQGTAPWGAPAAGELRADCPAGFQALPIAQPGVVLRCIAHVGTSAFTMLQLTQSSGGFGSETDRTRLATDIAQRVASAGGGRARVLVQPTPFTRARNVDAMRASFETDEHLTIDARVALVRAAGSGNVIAHYAGPDNDAGPAAAAQLVSSVKASRVSSAVLGAVSAALLALGALVGALLARDKRGSVSDSAA